jgi:NACHT domain
LQDTRTALLDRLWSWINSIDVKKSAEILLLTGVAGAGKTAIAHTFAKRCMDEEIISSFFFFDRSDANKNNPRMLFSNISRDLADQNSDFRQQVAHALDNKKSLVEDATSLHFSDLILEPSRCLPDGTPVVIIIDALDEGSDVNEVLTILRNDVHRLPGIFRILLTSSMMRELEFYLLGQSHVRQVSIDIEEPANLADTALYARRRLQEVAKWRKLGDDWPGSVLFNEFTLQAGGLFVWISVVSEYLRKSTNADAKLKKLLSKHGSSGLTPEKKMDETYSSILFECDWNDEDFVEGYNLFMGAIMAAKSPLSRSALQSLHRHSDLQAHDYLLGSLLTGLENDKTPIKILHHSLKDFLTVRAELSPASRRLFLSEKEHSQRLGLLCLKVMNGDLKRCRAAVRYLADASDSDLKGVPDIGKNVVSEELLYACNFWIAHVVEIEVPETSLEDELREFLSQYVIPWVEVSSSRGRFHNLSEVRQWVQVSISFGTAFDAF